MGRRGIRWALFAAMACLTVRTATASAEEPAPAPEETPWSKGVKAEDRTAGQQLFVEGNRLFGLEQYSAALAKYRAALDRYDHPSIRFNLAVTLIRVELPVEAYKHLVHAMRFGAAPFERPDLFEQAKTYRQLLEGRLTRLEVKCSLRGAKVSLNGEPLLTCPGTARRTLKPGAHQLVGTKSGYMTQTRNIVLMPGKQQVESVSLITIDAATVTKRRWPQWKPWAVVGAGAAVMLAGVPLVLSSRDNFARYDDHVALACPSGCPPGTPVDTSDLDRAELQQALGYSAFVVGGALAVSGLTLALLNRPRAVRRTDLGPPNAAARLRVTPRVGPGQVGVTLHSRF